jgi:hypothetical protein
MTINQTIKKPIKKDKFTKEVINGEFIETPQGFAWKEQKLISRWSKEFRTWETFSDETTLKDVSESPLKLKKSMVCDIIFVREDEDKNKWNSVNKAYFYLKLKYDIKDADNNLYLCMVDGKPFVKDLHFGMTCPIALNQSNENYKCVQIGEIEKISPQRATEIVKETGTRLIFSKVETDSSGNITNFGIGV